MATAIATMATSMLTATGVVVTVMAAETVVMKTGPVVMGGDGDGLEITRVCLVKLWNTPPSL